MNIICELYYCDFLQYKKNNLEFPLINYNKLLFLSQ